MILRSKEELKHYASKYYDPVKAHAYYLENRVLKGYEGRYGGPKESNEEYYKRTGTVKSTRRTPKSLTDLGKARWADVKARIEADRKAANKEDTANRKALIKEFRDRIKERQKERAKRNADYLKSQLAKSAAEEKARLAALTKATTTKTKKTIALKRIPEGATKTQRKAIQRQNEQIRGQNDRIRDQNDNIRSQNSDRRARVNSEKAMIKDSYREVRANYKAECKETLDEIKEMYKEQTASEVEKIREAYSDSKDKIKEIFNEVLDREYENLLRTEGADTAKGQNSGAGRSASEKKAIRERLAAERKRRNKK